MCPWDRIAAQIAAARSLSLSENARLFALLNVSMTDALISSWDSKFRYEFWRPITAIQGGDTDGNPGPDSDPAWTPWLANTPPFAEYPSGHSSVSGAAAAVLTIMFGDNTSFTVTSDVRPAREHSRVFLRLWKRSQTRVSLAAFTSGRLAYAATCLDRPWRGTFQRTLSAPNPTKTPGQSICEGFSQAHRSMQAWSSLSPS